MMKNSALAALVILAAGCEHKEASSTTDAGTMAAAVPSSSAGMHAAMPALSASGSPVAPPPASGIAHAIPSQADESMAAVKEIDKTNYKKALSAIEADLQ